MGKTFDAITPEVREFIDAQKMFFVATAPTSESGLINLSPKGLDGTLRVLDEHRLAYFDLTGSGVETIAHLKQNGRIVLMFCAFQGKPNILRIHGRGEVFEKGSVKYQALEGLFPKLAPLASARSIIHITAERIANACGYGVPKYTHEGTRDTMMKWAENRGVDGIREYQQKNNLLSLDGLPGLKPKG